MWIKRIKLKNFKSYAEAEFEFPAPEQGRNLVLIGAENGHGKTTLLEAIYLCLYGNDAIQYFQRAGLDSSKFKTHDFIQRALHQETGSQVARAYEMVLEMDLMNEHVFSERSIRIVRKWHFDHQSRYQEADNELMLYAIQQGGSLKPIADEEIQDYLEDYGLPSEYSPFFFFDGEQLVNRAKELGAGAWMSNALNGLLGIDLLNFLKTEMNTYKTKLYSNRASNKQQEQLTEAEQKLNEAQAETQRYAEELAQLKTQKEEAETQLDDLQQQLNGAGSTQHSSELIARMSEYEQNIKDLDQKIQAAILALPLAMLPAQDIGSLKKQLTGDFHRLQHEQHKDSTASRMEEFWHTFAQNRHAQEILPPSILTNEQLKLALRESWDSLFNKLPANASKIMQHNYLDENGFQASLNNIARIGSPENGLDQLNSQKNQQEQRLHEANQQYEQQKHSAANTDRLLESLKQTQARVSEIDQKLGGTQTMYNRSQSETQRLQTDWENLTQDLIDSLPKQQKAERAAAISTLIEDLAQRLRSSKLDAFRQTASRLHKKIAHDKQIDKISIGEDGTLSLFSQNGTPIEFQPLSHGEKKILVLTLIAALAEITDYQVPFVVDTPLTSLDTRHCNNLVNYWMNLNRQVIILVQSAELGAPAYQDLNQQGHVGKSSLIQSKSLKGGGKLASIKPNTYFEE